MITRIKSLNITIETNEMREKEETDTEQLRFILDFPILVQPNKGPYFLFNIVWRCSAYSSTTAPKTMIDKLSGKCPTSKPNFFILAFGLHSVKN